MAVRLKDIAQELGVSTVTVSKVLRGSPDISERTRARVLKRMRELDYQPNMQARALASGRSFTAGLVVPDLVHPFFGEFSKALGGALRAGGLALMVSSSEEDPEVEKQEIRALQNRGVDVLLIASCQPMRSKEVYVGERDTPFVLIDRNFPKLKVNFVGSDDVKAGEVATRHLILLGRRRIAHIGGEGLSPSVGRLAGYRKALLAAKLRMPEHYVVTRGRIEESGDSAGYQAMQELLGRRPLPDAVFCYNDLAAIGAMKAVMESGLRVPQDIAFVGCGNLRYAEYLKVPLSSIDQGTERMGFAAAKLALALAATKLPPKPETLLMEPTLVVRRSSMAD
jgi:LacI family transcriptional regulator